MLARSSSSAVARRSISRSAARRAQVRRVEDHAQHVVAAPSVLYFGPGRISAYGYGSTSSTALSLPGHDRHTTTTSTHGPTSQVRPSSRGFATSSPPGTKDHDETRPSTKTTTSSSTEAGDEQAVTTSSSVSSNGSASSTSSSSSSSKDEKILEKAILVDAEKEVLTSVETSFHGAAVTSGSGSTASSSRKNGSSSSGGGSSSSSSKQNKNASTSHSTVEHTLNQLPEEEISGHLWFSNIYPNQRHFLDFRWFFTTQNHRTLIPQLLPPSSIKIARYLPRKREGGVFVDFIAHPRFQRSILSKMGKSIKLRKEEKTNAEIHSFVSMGVQKFLKKNDYKAPLTNYYVRAHEVLGKPFIDEFIGRYPSNVLKVKLGEEVNIAAAGPVGSSTSGATTSTVTPTSSSASGSTGDQTTTGHLLEEVAVPPAAGTSAKSSSKMKMKTKQAKMASLKQNKTTKMMSKQDPVVENQDHKLVDIASPGLNLVIRGEKSSTGAGENKSDAKEKMQQKYQKALENATFFKEENLHAVMRSFGQLVDMKYDSASQEWRVQFLRAHSAVAARNCLHRAPLHKIYSSIVYRELRELYDARSTTPLEGGNAADGHGALDVAGGTIYFGEEDDAPARVPGMQRIRHYGQKFAERLTSMYVHGRFGRNTESTTRVIGAGSSTTGDQQLGSSSEHAHSNYTLTSSSTSSSTTSAKIPSTVSLPLPKTLPDEVIAKTQSTVFEIKYEQSQALRTLREQLVQNWRMAILALLGLVGFSTTFLFDPLRLFFVKRKIEAAYDRNSYAYGYGKSGETGGLLWFLPTRLLGMGDWLGLGALYRALRMSTSSASRTGRGRMNLEEQFSQARKEDLEKIKHWLRTDPPERVMLLTGPRGDGKLEVIQEIFRDNYITKSSGTGTTVGQEHQVGSRTTIGATLSAPREVDHQPVTHSSTTALQPVVELDFSPLLARNKDERFLLNALCRMFNYYPAMLIWDQSAALLDTVVPGASRIAGGSGGGMNEQVNTQLSRILSFTTVALAQHKEERRKREEKGLTGLSGGGTTARTSAGDIDQAKSSSNSGDAVPASLTQNTKEKYPLFVIEGFTQENLDSIPNLLELLIKWAALVSERKLAKVVFLIDGSWGHSFFQKVLKHRPDLLEEKVWGDVPMEMVREWLGERFLVDLAELEGLKTANNADEVDHKTSDALVSWATKRSTTTTSAATGDVAAGSTPTSSEVPTTTSTTAQELILGEKNRLKTQEVFPPAVSTGEAATDYGGINLLEVVAGGSSTTSSSSKVQTLDVAGEKSGQQVLSPPPSLLHVCSPQEKVFMINRILKTLGGRLSDLEILQSKIENDNMTPSEALAEMIETTTTTVRSLLVRDEKEALSANQLWSRNQLWKAIEILALGEAKAERATGSAVKGGQAAAHKNTSYVTYDAFLDYVLRGDERIMRHMLASQLITTKMVEVLGEEEVDHSGSAAAAVGPLRVDHEAGSFYFRRFGQRKMQQIVLPGSPLFGEVYNRLYLGEESTISSSSSSEGTKKDPSTRTSSISTSCRNIFGLSAVKEDIGKVEKDLQHYEAELQKVYTAEKDLRKLERDAHAVVHHHMLLAERAGGGTSTSSFGSFLNSFVTNLVFFPVNVILYPFNRSVTFANIVDDTTFERQKAVIEEKREEMEFKVFESRKLYLLGRIHKEQEKLKILIARKDEYSAENKKRKREIVPFAV
ncbi:unnamed protein product [Amoebophrya sp. A120]|nr:unnamed protein product [Amoebophrya sp. A120]|eukprot:GSA120T00004607001.1